MVLLLAGYIWISYTYASVFLCDIFKAFLLPDVVIITMGVFIILATPKSARLFGYVPFYNVCRWLFFYTCQHTLYTISISSHWYNPIIKSTSEPSSVFYNRIEGTCYKSCCLNRNQSNISTRPMNAVTKVTIKPMVAKPCSNATSIVRAGTSYVWRNESKWLSTSKADRR